jgi:hypothetical protein
MEVGTILNQLKSWARYLITFYLPRMLDNPGLSTRGSGSYKNGIKEDLVMNYSVELMRIYFHQT